MFATLQISNFSVREDLHDLEQVKISSYVGASKNIIMIMLASNITSHTLWDYSAGWAKQHTSDEPEN